MKPGSSTLEELDALASVLQLAGRPKSLELSPRGDAAWVPTVDKTISSLEAMGFKIYGFTQTYGEHIAVDISWDNFVGYDYQNRMSRRDIRDVCQQAERLWTSKIIRGQAQKKEEQGHSLPPFQEYIGSALKRQASIPGAAANQSRNSFPPSKKPQFDFYEIILGHTYSVMSSKRITLKSWHENCTDFGRTSVMLTVGLLGITGFWLLGITGFWLLDVDCWYRLLGITDCRLLVLDAGNYWLLGITGCWLLGITRNNWLPAAKKETGRDVSKKWSKLEWRVNSGVCSSKSSIGFRNLGIQFTV